MAISIEQEKKSRNWFSIMLIIIIAAVLIAGGYYLFFKKPELIEVVAPGRIQDLSQISQLEFDPQELLNSPEFKLLRQFGTDVEVSSPGRNNPFQPY